MSPVLPPPLLPRPHLPRPRLTGLLAGRRLSLLVAPAGYGKSVLLSEALQQSGGPGAWYGVTGADRDPSSLLSGLARALGAPPPVRSARELWSAEPPRFTLAIDGIEALAQAEESCRNLGELIDAAPGGVRIILAGRTLPQIPGLQRLRLNGGLAEVGPRDLLFTEAEAASLAGEGEADRLAGGWPAALRLLSSQGGPDWPRLFEYLEDEVLNSLDQSERSCLAQLALVEERTPEALNRLMERNDGEALLRDWAQRLPVNRQGGLHPLLWHYFAKQTRHTAADVRAMHRRAALWKAEQGDPRAALAHALAAGDVGLAALLLSQVGSRLLEAGRMAELEAHLDRAPIRVLEAAPELLLQVGEALRRAGAARRALRWLRSAAVGFAAGRDGGGLYRSFCRMALAHGDLGEWSEMRAALKQVEDEVEGASGRDRAEGLRALAEYQVHLGQCEHAAALFREAAELFQAQGDREGAGAALTGLGSGALVDLGRLDEAVDVLRQAQRLAGGANACEALLAEIQILIGRERWAEAEAALSAVVAGSAQQQARKMWAQAQIALGRGDAAMARRLRAEAGAIPPVRPGLAALPDEQPALPGWAVILDGWIALAEGDATGALACGRQAAQLSARGFPLLRFAAQQLVATAERAVGALRPAVVTPSAADRLRVECFGAFRLYLGEQEVPLSHWGRAQVRAILQVLLLQPGFAAPRERLLEIFWPEEAPAQSRARLRVGLNRLRQALQRLGISLQTGADLICLPRESVGFMDLFAFREHLATARRLVAGAPEAAIESCRAARALYRGPLLEDAFWPEVEEHRERAHREAIEVMQLWAAAAAHTGRHDEAIGALEDLLTLDPGNEEAVRQMMQALLRLGRNGEAVRRYRDLERWLNTELGVEPEPETRALLRQALR